jgi:hypothetical protein
MLIAMVRYKWIADLLTVPTLCRNINTGIVHVLSISTALRFDITVTVDSAWAVTLVVVAVGTFSYPGHTQGAFVIISEVDAGFSGPLSIDTIFRFESTASLVT